MTVSHALKKEHLNPHCNSASRQVLSAAAADYVYVFYLSINDSRQLSGNLIGNSGAKGVGRNIDTLMKDQAVVMSPNGHM